MADGQNYGNHLRWDPPLHFFIAPVLLINVFVAIGVLIHDWPQHNLLHLWLVVVSVALLLLGPVSRLASLRAQDRLIRLEELLRFRRVLNAAELPLVEQLNIRQIIALRFASDGELPLLVRRAAEEALSPKAIKEAVQRWRPDPLRV